MTAWNIRAWLLSNALMTPNAKAIEIAASARPGQNCQELDQRNEPERDAWMGCGKFAEPHWLQISALRGFGCRLGQSFKP